MTVNVTLVTPAGTQPFPTVEAAKRTAMIVGWTRDKSAVIQINDFVHRVVHEYDTSSCRWYEVEMWEGAKP